MNSLKYYYSVCVTFVLLKCFDIQYLKQFLCGPWGFWDLCNKLMAQDRNRSAPWIPTSLVCHKKINKKGKKIFRILKALSAFLSLPWFSVLQKVEHAPFKYLSPSHSGLISVLHLFPLLNLSSFLSIYKTLIFLPILHKDTNILRQTWKHARSTLMTCYPSEKHWLFPW